MSPWTNTANASWLHLSAANQTGAGSTNVIFTYDANPSTTRSGTLTIGGQTLNVTQAGSNYVQSGLLATLVFSGISFPQAVAVDGDGNVYFADTDNNAIKEWTVANHLNVFTLVGPGVGSPGNQQENLNAPGGVAVDGAGNVYFSDSLNNAIKEWTPSNSLAVTTLISSGVSSPEGIALDGAGNLYIADTDDSAIKEWLASTGTLITLVSNVVSSPFGVAVDAAGNVYIADSGNNAVEEWMPVYNAMTTVVSGLNFPTSVAVDGAGNLYIADSDNNRIVEWNAASKIVTTLKTLGASYPTAVAVDGTGNVYIAQVSSSAIEELPYAFVNPTPITETEAAGSDVLPTVLPPNENLAYPFFPTSEQSWLTLPNIADGVVNFSFTADTNGSPRTANIDLLGINIPVTQQMSITPPILISAQILGNGALQFSFTNAPGGSFSVLSTTNLAVPVTDWTVVGTAVNIGSNQFQFTSQPTTNDAQLFYTVRSP